MEIINVNYVGEGIKVSDYSQRDDALLSLNYINSQIGDSSDYIEQFIYDESNQILSSNYDYKNYKLGDQSTLGSNRYSSIIVDPAQDAKDEGFDRGRVTIQYNILKRLFNSKQGQVYWIKEISSSRRELKLSSQVITDSAMKSGLDSFQSYILTKNYYGDFYLNFGLNNLILAVNAAYIEDDDGNPAILIKLYDPLPFEFDIKSTLWIVDKIAESVSYIVDIQIEAEDVFNENKLRGPNYNIKLVEKIGQTTPYYNYNSLFSANASSSIQQLLSYYEDKAISINVDFSDFSNFVHFSSATERLENFKYKIQLIESYTGQISQQQSITGNNQVTSASVTLLQNNINKIIEKFDLYEYYLYYSSESFAWPKRTSTKPYSLYSVTSSEAINWLGSANTPTSGITTASLLYSASSYDANNVNNLVNSIPLYLVDDPSNAPYTTFMNMVGQHFDNIWIYYKDLSNRYNATNNPKTGISLDVVADAIKSFGIELYTNTNLSDEVYYTLFGFGQSGTLLPPTGSEVIKNYVTSSYETLPYDQVQKEVYKRLYHNLPYLLKTRGTERGVKALVSCFGIPSDILSVNQFGGFDRLEKSGLIDLNNDKITIISQSLELSQSVLSPYATVQYFDDDNRLNSTAVEIGFSPSDQLNKNISSSLGYISLDNLVGNPSYQYLQNYPALDRQRDSYFSSYTKKHNVWEYIRLIKYYNNSLFKMVKDFVPARATVSSGIIIKPHILERSKYARHEPSASIELISQSIDMISISGDAANSYDVDTTTQKSIPTAIGYVPYTSSYGFERYTGEFQNSEFSARDSYAFNQNDPSNDATILNSVTIYGTSQSLYFGDVIEYNENYRHGIGPISILRSPIFQNVSNAVRSQRYLDVDYSYNPLVPVNMSIINQTISRSQVDNIDTYTDPNAPYAQLQDYNYNIQRSTIPRYFGSKTQSSKYLVYSNGDDSYGNTAAIDKIKRNFAYLKTISTASLTLPNRANAEIKYLINDQNQVVDLSKTNTNLFQVQNVFKSGETIDVSLFKYDSADPEIQRLSNNSTLEIYQGGFKYLPILHQISASSTIKQAFNIFPAIESTSTSTGGIPYVGFLPADVTNQANWKVEVKREFDFSFDYYYFRLRYIGATPIPTNGNWFINFTVYAGHASPANYGPYKKYIFDYDDWSAGGPGNFNYDIGAGGSESNLPNGGGLGIGTLSFTTKVSASVVNPDGTFSTDFGGTYYKANIDTENPWPLSTWFERFTGSIYGTQWTWSISQPSVPGPQLPDTSTTTYITSITASVTESILYYSTASNQFVLKGPIANYYGYDIVYDSTSDPAWSNSIMEKVIYPFTVTTGDEIHLYNSQSGWYEKEEYVIRSAYTGGVAPDARLYIDVDKTVNLSSLNSMPQDPVTFLVSGSKRYVFVKKIPDETNIVIRYNPQSNITEEGMVYPEYINEDLRRSSGDIIKSLKSDNLI